MGTCCLDLQGVLNILEAVRAAGLTHVCRIYQASTSELYGKVKEVPQTENTEFYPRSPYAVSKLFGFWIIKNYRQVNLSIDLTTVFHFGYVKC